MSRKHMIAFAGVILILTLSLPSLAESSQAAQKAGLEKSKFRPFDRGQNRIQFIDEDGDGICDYYRDHDNDGIPNRQDPDWTRPQDGTGYQIRNGNQGESNRFGQGNGFGRGNDLSNRSFRYQQARAGNCGAVRYNSRGNGYRGGKH